MPEVTMPRLSDSMEEGTILRWLKSDGDEVKQGEELAEIETDKATMTYEADAEGTLHIVADEGSTLPIGELIATIGEEPPDGASSNGGGTQQQDEQEDEERGEEDDEDEAADQDGDEGAQGTAEPDDQDADEAEQREEPKADASQDGADRDGGRIKASPVARRLAEEQGVDLGSLEGTGPGGRIVKADVEKAASGDGAAAQPEEQPEAEPAGEEDGRATADEEAEPAAASAAASPATSEPQVTETGTNKGDVSTVELTRTQQLVARRMSESKATIPDFTLTTEADMERCVELRAQLKEIAGEDGVVPSYNDMVVKACAVALRDFPRANGSYKDGRFELFSRVNVGVAVAAQDSLVVPVIHDADGKSLGEVARTMKTLAARVRDGTIRPPELSGGTFTVSNLGMYGVTEFTAVINPPQAAILAVGALQQKPVVHDGAMTIRHRMGLTIVCDHRILYGADAADFLKRIRELLEEPLAFAL